MKFRARKATEHEVDHRKNEATQVGETHRVYVLVDPNESDIQVLFFRHDHPKARSRVQKSSRAVPLHQPPSTVTADDSEVEAGLAWFLSEYKVALDRLAK